MSCGVLRINLQGPLGVDDYFRQVISLLSRLCRHVEKNEFVLSVVEIRQDIVNGLDASFGICRLLNFCKASTSFCDFGLGPRLLGWLLLRRLLMREARTYEEHRGYSRDQISFHCCCSPEIFCKSF